ncbi:MAG TPA: DUF4861 family protein [Rhodanobacteraceae bacterium]
MLPRWKSGLLPVLLAIMPGMVWAGATAPRPLVLTVANPLPQARDHAVLALPLARIWQQRPAWRGKHLAAYAGNAATRLPTQPYASHGGTPDQLLVQLKLAAQATVHLRIQPAAHAYVAKANPLFARNVPERYGDFAWENELVAFRLYGTPLEAVGQVFSGIDVWSKKPGRHVINAWYAGDAHGRSYHVDHGDGLDSYAVGHTPGDGGVAAWWHGRPVYSRNATRVRITAMGPIRLRFVVDYAPWQVGPATVRERKVVTLDAGAHFNRQSVTWHFTGVSHLPVAAGVAVHHGAEWTRDAAASVAVWDMPQKAGAGRIATGLVLAPGQTARHVRGQKAAWLVFDVADGGRIRFASGAGWAKGDVPNFAVWRARVATYRQRWSHPLKVTWQTPSEQRR